jgi:hypothetical protein
MTKTQLSLISRAISNGGTVQGKNKRESEALDFLLGGRFVSQSSPDSYTLTDHGRAAYESFLRYTA